MSEEQFKFYLRAMEALLLAGSESPETIRLRDSECTTGMRLIWLGKESNGYINLSHEEAMLICGTTAKSTMRYHLMRLRNAGVLQTYSTNGTVRVKITNYPGSELIVHERKSVSESSESREPCSRDVLMASTKTRTASTPEGENSGSREWGSRDRAAGQLLRAAGSRDRAAGQHYNRSFDDYPQKCAPMLVSKIYTPASQEELLTNLTAQNRKEIEIPIDPVAEAHAFTFLIAAGFWPNTAKSLAKQYPFDLLRRAVGHWYTNRKSQGGQFNEKPGIVLSWLEDIDNTAIPPLSQEFKRSDLYHNHITKAERKEIDDAEHPTDEELISDPDMDTLDDMDPAERMLYWQQRAAQKGWST